MRRVFSLLEKAQRELLNRLNVSFFDPRLRSAREHALKLFEQTWSLADRRGIIRSEEDVAPLYTHCLARALVLLGVQVPNNLLPKSEKIDRLLQEKLP
jgi:hypothetical protein